MNASLRTVWIHSFNIMVGVKLPKCTEKQLNFVGIFNKVNCLLTNNNSSKQQTAIKNNDKLYIPEKEWWKNQPPFVFGCSYWWQSLLFFCSTSMEQPPCHDQIHHQPSPFQEKSQNSPFPKVDVAFCPLFRLPFLLSFPLKRFVSFWSKGAI